MDKFLLPLLQRIVRLKHCEDSDIFSACRILFWCMHNPLNSDVDYRIFSVPLRSLCLRMHTAVLGLYSYRLIRRTFVEPAHNLTLEKHQGRPRAYYVTVTRPLVDHAPSCLTLAFESECSCFEPLTLLFNVKVVFEEVLTEIPGGGGNG